MKKIKANLLLRICFLVILALLATMLVEARRTEERIGLSVEGKWATTPGSILAVGDSAVPLVVAEPSPAGGCEIKGLDEKSGLFSIWNSSSVAQTALVAGGKIWVLGGGKLSGVDSSGKSVTSEQAEVIAVDAQGDVLAYVRKTGPPADARQLWAPEELVVMDVKRGKLLYSVPREGRRAVAISLLGQLDGTANPDGVKVAIGSILPGYPLRSTVEFYGAKGKRGEWVGAEGLVRCLQDAGEAGSVYAATRNLVVRLDLTGKVLWKYYTTDDVLALCPCDDGVIIALASGTGNIPLLNWVKKDRLIKLGSNGAQAWSCSIAGGIRGLSLGPLISGSQTVAVSTRSGLELFTPGGERVGHVSLEGGARAAHATGDRLYALGGDWILWGLRANSDKR